MRRLYLALVCVISILSSGNIGAINIKLEAIASSIQIDLSETKQVEDNSNTGKMDAVDLGLSVKWASCNVGAESPEDYGGYYAWGETEEKEYYGWGTYKWCNGGGYSMTKYCADSNCGEIDNNRTIDLSDDVAHVKWGGKWRMPTLDELKELKENCDWQWFTLNEISGYRITGPNGNSIFLPAAGYRSGTDVDSRGWYGHYWSSTLNSGWSSHAYYFNFYAGNYSDSNISRYSGLSVRSVWDEKIRDNTSVITVVTKDVTGITHGGAKLSGVVNGSPQSLPCGFIYGTTSTLASTSGLKKNITSNGGYSISVTELKENTIYYYRAYAIVDGVYKYGEVKSFTTKKAEVNSNTDKKEAVDLGLSVKWASCNIGAKSPEDYGSYYAWGEIEEKVSYNWYTYKWCDGCSYNSLTKYCIDSELGKVDKKKTLDLSDDVAHMKWGGKWRMPTSEELRELIDNCNWERVRVNRINGYRVTGPNGNSIFLPAAGYRFGTLDYDCESFGHYWSATLGSIGLAGSDEAHYLNFKMFNDGYDVYNDNRSLGYTIRPVTD